jgi:ubiquitin carboxyl-terminal hydrolase L3
LNLAQESNPELMNKYASSLGFPTAMYHFVDILSTDDWALDMVPRPVGAVVFLYPIKESTEAFRKEEADRIAAEGQIVSDKLFYTKQTVGNACGTIGLLHAVANLSEETGGPVPLTKGKFWSNFLAKTASMTPDERAKALEEDTEVRAAIQRAHNGVDASLGLRLAAIRQERVLAGASWPRMLRAAIASCACCWCCCRLEFAA